MHIFIFSDIHELCVLLHILRAVKALQMKQQRPAIRKAFHLTKVEQQLKPSVLMRTNKTTLPAA